MWGHYRNGAAGEWRGPINPAGTQTILCKLTKRIQLSNLVAGLVTLWDRDRRPAVEVLAVRRAAQVPAAGVVDVVAIREEGTAIL